MSGVHFREENFGYTVFDIKSGKRIYITKEEFKSTAFHKKLEKDYGFSIRKGITVVPKQLIQGLNGFSFMDTIFLQIPDTNKDKTLSREEIFNLIYTLSQEGLQEIKFIGKNLLSNKNFYDYAKYTSKLGMRPAVDIHSKFLTEEMHKKFKESGLFNFSMSFDDTPVKTRIVLPFDTKRCSAGNRMLWIMDDGYINMCGLLASNGYPHIGNIRNIKDWSAFWIEHVTKNPLRPLQVTLRKYIAHKKIQPTFCLATIVKQKER